MKDIEKILIGIIVQQFQPVTFEDVIEEAKKLDYELEKEDVIYVLENMQRRDLLSVIYTSRENVRVKAYGMAKPIFKKCPEVSQIKGKGLLPSLINKKENKEFLDLLEGKTSNTEKNRPLGYREYKNINLVFETITTIVGGSINEPEVMPEEIEEKVLEIKKLASKKKKEMIILGTGYFNRDIDGEIIYTPNQVRQYLLKNLRIDGVGEAAINQNYFDKAKILRNGHKFHIEQWSIIIDGKGRGIKTAEALHPPVRLEVSFRFPFVGTPITTPETLKQVIAYQAEHGVGFSCYCKKFGKCKLIDFQVEELPWKKNQES